MPLARRSIFRRAFSLIELAVVMAIITILVAVSVPAISALTKSSSDGATRTALRSLFASLRARAATSQQYVGIRFQQDKEGRSYAIMLTQPPPGTPGFANGCPDYTDQDNDGGGDCAFLTLVAVQDVEPIPLPKGVELAAGDVNVRADGTEDPSGATGNVNLNANVAEATAFTVVFSPAGQLVRRQVHVSQRSDMPPRAANPNTPVTDWDRVFNLTAARPGGVGLFLPDIDDRGQAALPPPARTDPGPQDLALARMSQVGLWIYERQSRLDAGVAPFTAYVRLQGSLVQLNSYTGAPIDTRR